MAWPPGTTTLPPRASWLAWAPPASARLAAGAAHRPVSVCSRRCAHPGGGPAGRPRAGRGQPLAGNRFPDRAVPRWGMLGHRWRWGPHRCGERRRGQRLAVGGPAAGAGRRGRQPQPLAGSAGAAALQLGRGDRARSLSPRPRATPRSLAAAGAAGTDRAAAAPAATPPGGRCCIACGGALDRGRGPGSLRGSDPDGPDHPGGAPSRSWPAARSSHHGGPAAGGPAGARSAAGSPAGHLPPGAGVLLPRGITLGRSGG